MANSVSALVSTRKAGIQVTYPLCYMNKFHGELFVDLGYISQFHS